jgi:hypothetical protein
MADKTKNTAITKAKPRFMRVEIFRLRMAARSRGYE